MRREALICIFLALATLAVFSAVRHHDFIHLDDDLYITENPYVQKGLTGDTIKWAFTTTRGGLWIPLTWLSLMLEFELFGLKAGGYLLNNLLFHLANTLLLFLLLKRVTGQIWRTAFVAAVFALHPLRVESVAWAVERKDVLSTFFLLLILHAYVRYTENRAFYVYASALFFFLLGLMSKPMVVTLPCLLLLMDYWPLGRLNFGASELSQAAGPPDPGRKGPTFSLLLYEKLPFFLLSVIFGIVTFLAQRNTGALSSLQRLPVWDRLANALVSYAAYIGKMVWPRNLAVLYPHPGDTLPGWQVAAAGLFLAVVTAFVIWSLRRRYRYPAVGWLWYLITLLPVIGLVQAGSQAMADRFTYIPLVGIFVIIAWGVPDLVGGWRPCKVLLPLSAGLVLALLMLCTWSQVKYWRDSITLFEHTLQVTENNSPIHNNLGIVFLEQRRFADAASHFSKALQIRPNNARAHINLAVSLAHLGELQKAVEHYRRALKLAPDHAGAHNNLGNVLLIQGRVDEAAAEFARALELDPDYAEAHNNLGVVLVRRGKFAEAIGHFREALRVKPDYRQARANLALALQQAKKKGK